MELLSYRFLYFTIVDLIDVVVVSFIIYKFLSLLKGTRAAQMIAGLTLLFIVSFFAYWFQLQGLMWLFTNFATVGFIILVVLFQPEIRGALARISYSRLVKYFYRSAETASIDEIAKAAIQMAELRQGALIVMERSVGLRDFVASGSKINAGISAQILTTIFTPYTPLHDGAVIIRGDMIVAAGCMLPLSKNPLYMHSHGMRHKAAAGITEETDAVCVAVSEEDGSISIAKAGRLERIEDQTQLKDILIRRLQEK
ncbi:MAG: diadenylate cyclase CdaA [candidate division Zixibacteria bacterium]|nr:diadenylate cyclase CdaA [candidate division Zixibacteria bacterium]